MTSTNFPDNYGNNELCRYTLNAEPGKIIKIDFEHFDVENNRDCDYDSLRINGRKHCGRKQHGFGNKRNPPQTVYVFAESTELEWITDGSVTRGGFSLSWESVENPNGATASGPLESAAGFHNHMESFYNQLIYQMEFRRPWMSKALTRFWSNIQIAEDYFQGEGECEWDHAKPSYNTFDFKEFDDSASKCDNLNNFATNANAFLNNFVCMDGHELPKRTWMKWKNSASKIFDIGFALAHHC